MAAIRIEMINGKMYEYHGLDPAEVEKAHNLLQGTEGSVFIEFTTA